jgi:hypothetical protein
MKRKRRRLTKPPKHFRQVPDFELAPLEAFDPSVFESVDAKADAFILMLAHVFNDMKVLTWVAYQMSRGRPRPLPRMPDAYLGQIVGFEEWTNRQGMSLIREVLELIRKSADIIETPRLKRCVAALPRDAAASWRALIDASTSAASESDFVQYLVKVRANVAYHYSQPKALMAGYRHHYRQTPLSELNESVFVSMGPQLEKTRFYFADAAAQAYVRRLIGSEAHYQKFDEYLKRVNGALRFLVENYLRLRQAEISARQEAR